MAQRLTFQCAIAKAGNNYPKHEIRATLTRRSEKEWSLEFVIKGTGSNNFREEHKQESVVIRTTTDSVRQAKFAALERLKLSAATFLRIIKDDLAGGYFTANWFDSSD